MDLSKTASLLLQILQWMDQNPQFCFSGSEIKEYSKELSPLLSSQILRELTPDTEIVCRHPCEYDCSLKVHRREYKLLLVCPRHLVAPKEITREEVSRYQFSLPKFLAAVAKINRLNPDEEISKPFPPGVYFLGESRNEKAAICFYRGIVQEQIYTTLLSLRMLINQDRIVVLLPVIQITDQALLAHLADNRIYPVKFQMCLKPGTLEIDWNKIIENIQPKVALQKEVVLTINTKRREISYKEHTCSLPPLAFDLFLLLARRCKDVVSRDEIHTSLWGEPSDPAEYDRKAVYDRQIDDHIRKIRQRLQESGVSPDEINALIITHKKVGLQLNLPSHKISIM